MKSFRKLMLATAILSTLANTADAGTTIKESTTQLMTANFEPRNVVQIEVGDFHFVPGQIGPVHTHVAPAVGYVAKGEIIYQVEGRKPVFLKEGDAFYEPAGPRILRFDNASATEEAIFIDVNLEQEDEPFIVFEEELTEDIDRRSLPTIELDGRKVDTVDIFVSELEPSGVKELNSKNVMLGYVTEGIITVNGTSTRRIVAGASFSLEAGETVNITNESFEVPAKVVAFYIR